MSRTTPLESPVFTMEETPSHVLRLNKKARTDLFSGISALWVVLDLSLITPPASPISLSPSITFDIPDDAGNTSVTLPYGTDAFHPTRGIWPIGTVVTVTAPQIFSTGGFSFRFFGWWSGATNDYIFPDSNRTFTADTAYVGSDPVLTFAPNDYADSFDAMVVQARYARRYIVGVGADGDFGILGQSQVALVELYADGINYAAGSTILNLSAGIWTLSAPGITYSKTGGDPLGNYVDDSNPMHTINIVAGGFAP